MVEWYIYALVTMLCFSLGNITLKSLLSQKDLNVAMQANPGLLFPIAAIAAIALAAVYFLFLSKLGISQNTWMLLIGFVLFAGIGFLFLLAAVSSGKIAPVTAIVSTSNIMVAILSVILLKDVLKPQEIAGILAAFIGVALLIFA
jgi:drug/metabolite transporter (DMT)-like permease